VGLAAARTTPHKRTHLKQHPRAVRDGHHHRGHVRQAGNPEHYVAIIVLCISQGEARRDCDAQWHAAMVSHLFPASCHNQNFLLLLVTWISLNILPFKI